jgi:tRNA (cmo5U34)-methyltransferase
VWTPHQLPDFDVLRAALRQIAAVRRHSGAAIWIFDLRRLRDPSALPALASCVDPSMAPVLRKDALASEAAGSTEAELIAELTAAGLDNMSSGRARPLPFLQAHWAPGMNAKSDGWRIPYERRPSRRGPPRRGPAPMGFHRQAVLN